MKPDDMRRFYSLFPWPEDLEGSGRERYERALRYFRRVVEHPFFSGKSFRILDLMGGVGIGGVALGKVLREAGKEIELAVLDLRKEALNRAGEFALRELGSRPILIEGDAFRVHELVDEADVVLIYGLTMPHFDPWSAIPLLNSAREVVGQDGAVLIHHLDQVYWEGYMHPRREIYPFFNGHVALSLHRGYDFRKGSESRIMLSPATGEAMGYDVYQWSLSLLSALVWIFFEDVEYFPILSDGSAGIVMGVGSRPGWRVDDLEIPPAEILE